MFLSCSRLAFICVFILFMKCLVIVRIVSGVSPVAGVLSIVRSFLMVVAFVAVVADVLNKLCGSINFGVVFKCCLVLLIVLLFMVIFLFFCLLCLFVCYVCIVFSVIVGSTVCCGCSWNVIVFLS